MDERNNKPNIKILRTPKTKWCVVVLLLFFGWAIFWPMVMRYVTTHKAKNIYIELYDTSFADMNPVQLKAAKQNGITPVNDRTFDFEGCQQLIQIESSDAYCVDKLTHSVPYLTPAAAKLLENIGKDFQIRAQEAGLGKCRVVVTSVLRTKDDVMHLSKTNSNASDNSAHCYGTTFDLSYYRFKTCGWVSWDTYDDKLVEILTDVLTEKRQAGLCYVRFEKKQHCFHITNRR